jgi:hypothetical protein
MSGQPKGDSHARLPADAYPGEVIMKHLLIVSSQILSHPNLRLAIAPPATKDRRFLDKKLARPF